VIFGFIKDVQLQIKSFQLLLQKGIIEEFSKRNPIRDSFLLIRKQGSYAQLPYQNLKKKSCLKKK
jgi:hypothetical protein